MVDIKGKLEVFNKIYNFIQESYPNYFMSLEHETVEPELAMISGISLTLWDDSTEEAVELNRIDYKFGQLLAVLNQNGFPELTMDDIESFIEIEALFSNQMNEILPEYESGWDISKTGLKLKEEAEYHTWEQVEVYIKERAKWYSFEDILTI